MTQNDAGRPEVLGVATAGPWTWQRRAVEDVVSELFMSTDAIAEFEREDLEARRRRTEQSLRQSRETLRKGEYFSAALRAIRSRHDQG